MTSTKIAVLAAISPRSSRRRRRGAVRPTGSEPEVERVRGAGGLGQEDGAHGDGHHQHQSGPGDVGVDLATVVSGGVRQAPGQGVECRHDVQDWIHGLSSRSAGQNADPSAARAGYLRNTRKPAAMATAGRPIWAVARWVACSASAPMRLLIVRALVEIVSRTGAPPPPAMAMVDASWDRSGTPRSAPRRPRESHGVSPRTQPA